MQLCEHLLAVSSSEKSSKLKTQRLCLKTEQKNSNNNKNKIKKQNKTNCGCHTLKCHRKGSVIKQVGALRPWSGPRRPTQGVVSAL